MFNPHKFVYFSCIQKKNSTRLQWYSCARYKAPGPLVSFRIDLPVVDARQSHKGPRWVSSMKIFSRTTAWIEELMHLSALHGCTCITIWIRNLVKISNLIFDAELSRFNWISCNNMYSLTSGWQNALIWWILTVFYLLRIEVHVLAHLRQTLKWAIVIARCPALLSVCKLFTFSTSSPKPLNGFDETW